MKLALEELGLQKCYHMTPTILNGGLEQSTLNSMGKGLSDKKSLIRCLGIARGAVPCDGLNS
jgi:hypothetical protein